MQFNIFSIFGKFFFVVRVEKLYIASAQVDYLFIHVKKRFDLRFECIRLLLE